MSTFIRLRTLVGISIGIVFASLVLAIALAARPADQQSDTGNTLLVFVSPGCDYCQEQIQEIRRHAQAFAAYRIVLVSDVTIDELRGYRNELALDTTRFSLQADATLDWHERYRIQTYPTSLLFDAEGKLIDRFVGETPAATISSKIKSHGSPTN